MVINQSGYNSEEIKRIILTKFFFLEEEYFYSPTFKKIEDNSFLQWIEVEYKNQVRRRIITISCTKGQVYDELKYTFSLSITRIPYSGNEDFFSFSTYLKSIGQDFNFSMLDDLSKRNAESKFDQIATALKEHASKIIEGALWLESFYPRKD